MRHRHAIIADPRYEVMSSVRDLNSVDVLAMNTPKGIVRFVRADGYHSVLAGWTLSAILIAWASTGVIAFVIGAFLFRC